MTAHPLLLLLLLLRPAADRVPRRGKHTVIHAPCSTENRHEMDLSTIHLNFTHGQQKIQFVPIRSSAVVEPLQKKMSLHLVYSTFILNLHVVFVPQGVRVSSIPTTVPSPFRRANRLMGSIWPRQ